VNSSGISSGNPSENSSGNSSDNPSDELADISYIQDPKTITREWAARGKKAVEDFLAKADANFAERLREENSDADQESGQESDQESGQEADQDEQRRRPQSFTQNGHTKRIFTTDEESEDLLNYAAFAKEAKNDEELIIIVADWYNRGRSGGQVRQNERDIDKFAKE